MHSVLSPPGAMSTPPPPSAADARAAVAHLLTRAASYPCSAATPAFARLAQHTSTFQLALDALLPVLDPPTSSELTERILVSFLLFALYAPHPIAINPFKSVLLVTFVRERAAALAVADAGAVAPNEPLVWVLWKILKGDGDDIGPYSPSALARSLLPPNFRATKLILDDTLYRAASDPDDTTYTTSYASTPRTTTPAPLAPRTITRAEDERAEAVAHAMCLLLAARERVLSLAEQRHLTPHLPTLAASAMIATPDLAPVVAHNPGLAHPLFVALLSCPPRGVSSSASAPVSSHPGEGAGVESEIRAEATGYPPSPYLDILAYLPPTLPTFDFLGRLLRDGTPLGGATPTPTPATNGANDPTVPTTVGALVRAEVLGRFVTESVAALDAAAEDARADLGGDYGGGMGGDAWARGVRHLCRFYASLLKLGIVDAGSDADTAAMAHFALRHARFEEANALYRMLALRRV
ncbi:hypothetical protein B0H10DRAFT_2037499 [Mycena sp. CBHHK59/15]|nr:hypothetical protein B0H10DRAFT_2037499 [Mycena sp. CBHHK59/15]